MAVSTAVFDDDERRRRAEEAAAFLYRKRSDGSVDRWSDGKIEAAKYINPYRAKSVWTVDDVHYVFDVAAAEVTRSHTDGKLQHGITSSYVKIAIRDTAIDYWHRFADERRETRSLRSR